MAERFDAIIVGAGQAGSPLAAALSRAGRKVAIVERHLVGGTCVNAGCIPTKALVASAKVARMAQRAAEFGIVLDGAVQTDMSAVRARKDRISGKSHDSVEAWIAGMAHCTLIRGHARFLSPHRLDVGGREIEADQIFLNVGGRPSVPDLPGVRDVPFLTSTTIMRLDTVPRHLIVVGGSYIGLEFAQMFRRFGAEVTVVEKSDRLIAREDPDASQCIREIIEAEGIAVRTSAECIRFRREGSEIAVGVDCEAGAPEVVGSHVLLAMGRTPNTGDLGLDAAGVDCDARGYIVVDDGLRTSVPHIWAMGDCNGRGAFTHTAYNDYEIVADHVLGPGTRRVTDRISTYGLFVDPPLARAGMNEAEARATGRRLAAGMRKMTRVGRAVEKSEDQGFMRVLLDLDTQEILGAVMIGPGADEAIHGVLDLMYAKAPFTTLEQAVHIHPTVAELLPTIVGERKPLKP